MSYIKKCPNCPDGFIHRRGSLQCRKCHVKSVSPWKNKNERIKHHRDRKSKWFQENKNKIRERIIKKRNENPELTKNQDFKYFIKYMYNISYEEYEKMLIEQNYRCKICGFKTPKNKRLLKIDHDHKTKKIRGLLCFNCNTALGKFNDCLTNLENAVHYLKNYDTRNDRKNTFGC